MWHGPPNVVVVTEMKEGWVLRINSVPSFFVCCIFLIISIPFNCSDIAIRVAKTVIGAKVITLYFVIFASFLEFRTRTRCLQSVSSAFFHLGNRAEISHINQGGIGPRQPGSWEEALKWPTCRFILGSLSNDDGDGDGDGDGNENGKKAIGLDWQNNNFARASLFFVHFFAVVARLRRESAFFHVLSRMAEHKTTTFFFFSWTLIQSFRIQLQKNLPTFDELNEME